MLYASTRASLMKSLGSASFTDSIFATSKADLTPEAYESHRKHVSAPKPLSAREQEMATIRAAEAASSSYEGNKARASPLSTGVGLTWTEDVENAVKQLGEGEDSGLVIIVRIRLSSTDPSHRALVYRHDERKARSSFCFLNNCRCSGIIPS